MYILLEKQKYFVLQLKGSRFLLSQERQWEK